jgi:ubiquinone/menaquinone biosynthesis C-methylase UbiE
LIARPISLRANLSEAIWPSCEAWIPRFAEATVKRPVINQVRASLLSRWYTYLAGLLVASPIVCLNYGYAPSAESDAPALGPSDEPMRHYLQLYAFVAGAVDLEGRDLLEISCGYGGGAAYVARRWRPRRCIGVDLTEAPLRLAKQRFASERLGFLAGRADRLGLAPTSFDAVLSIEASHCYPSITMFFREVFRVLRPGGYLVLADYRPVTAIDTLNAEIDQSGLRLEGERDITANILRSLEETHDQRKAWIARYGPFWLRPLMDQLAGVRGSIIYRGFLAGRIVYKRYLLRKP